MCSGSFFSFFGFAGLASAKRSSKRDGVSDSSAFVGSSAKRSLLFGDASTFVGISASRSSKLGAFLGSAAGSAFSGSAGGSVPNKSLKSLVVVLGGASTPSITPNSSSRASKAFSFFEKISSDMNFSTFFCFFLLLYHNLKLFAA